LLKRLYFPVRSDFFYQTPTGIFVNLVMSAWSMYPPVFREPAKRNFNEYGLRRLIELLQQPGTVVGMHPEGTRGKGPDPYRLGRAQPGIGKLIIEAKPTVVPIFINGLGNHLPKQVWGNFDGTGPPVVIVAGDPLDLSAFYQRRNSLRVQKELADHVVAEIQQLSQRERALREQLQQAPRRGPLCYPA
jgi:1-acyl-sn-glycerol-3-phosphate acyltransferase